VRLILHIGTHKTGTTAVQRFLVANRPVLTQHGIHYASPVSTPDSNVVANAVATGDTTSAQAFFQEHIDTARQAGAQTVVVSAENFYSMTVVAAALAGRVPENAASQEPVLVRRLQSALPAEITGTQVVGYFRRPDRLAESLYNQRIKYENFDETFDRYLQLVEPMFGYHQIATAWADAFGADNCTFQIYESVTGDVRLAFLRDILGMTDTESFVLEEARDNERLSRDVLEFKRELNGAMPDDERPLEYRLACLLEQRLNLLRDEPRHYQAFLSPTARAEFVNRWAADTAALQSSFGLPPFPPLAEAGVWQAYPGLSGERRAELRQEYAQISGQLGFRLERLGLRTSRALRRRRGGRALVTGWRRTGLQRPVRRIVRRAQSSAVT
jgi:hypothetical protein